MQLVNKQYCEKLRSSTADRTASRKTVFTRVDQYKREY